MKVNCIIVDNDSSSRKEICTYLHKFKDFNVIGEANNTIDALKFIQNNKIDLIFLDINLPDMSGIELLKSLINPPRAIVVSADAEYAIDCFELSVIDYLLKPIITEKFLRALNKFRCDFRNSNKTPIIDIKRAVKSPFLKLEINRKTYNLNLSNIVYIESMREFVKIHFENKDSLVLKYVLSKLEKQLPGEEFVRVHKSYIIATNKIRAFTIKYIEIAEKKIPIGAFYKKETVEALSIN